MTGRLRPAVLLLAMSGAAHASAWVDPALTGAAPGQPVTALVWLRGEATADASGVAPARHPHATQVARQVARLRQQATRSREPLLAELRASGRERSPQPCALRWNQASPRVV